jgi:hypothetical protein
MDNDKFDLNNLPNKYQLSIVPREDHEERDSRLRIEEANAAHERRKDWLFSVSVLVVIGVALCLCVWAIVSKGSATADKEWAFLTAIVTGLIGYAFGRATK